MRLRLSRAAYEVIAERGHSAFRTAAVALRAGVSQGALLHHFATKDAVTLAAIEHALQIASSVSEKRLSKAGDSVDAVLDLMLADFRSFFRADSFWVALDITMDASKSSNLAPRIRKIVADSRRPIYDRWVAKLVECGWARERSIDAVRGSAALVSGFAIRSLWTDDGGAARAIDRRWLEFVKRRP
jgi:AcrR family transcriptional regulator